MPKTVWNTTIDSTSLGTEENPTLINNLNAALNTYEEARLSHQITDNHLSTILMAAEAYLTSIPPERRTRESEDIKWVTQLPEWPNAERIQEIQKKVCMLITLYERNNTNAAQARWDVLRNKLGFSDGKHGKALDKDYIGEMQFNGQAAVANWLTNNNEEAKTHLFSAIEVMNLDSIAGVRKKSVEYITDPEPYKLHIVNKEAYRDGKLVDSTKARGNNIEETPGHCIFVASVNGDIYTNDPAKYLTGDLHHSSFLSGKPVMCAGTLKIENGNITEVTVISGHYKPSRAELLDFLTLLQNKHGLDLNKIAVLDRPGGDLKNAMKYLQTKGNCLPMDLAAYQLKLANLSEDQGEWKDCQKYLDAAIKAGSITARLSKAQFLLDQPQMYSHLSQDKRKAEAKEILLELAELKAPNPNRRMARNLLEEVFNLDLSKTAYHANAHATFFNQPNKHTASQKIDQESEKIPSPRKNG